MIAKNFILNKEKDYHISNKILINVETESKKRLDKFTFKKIKFNKY